MSPDEPQPVIGLEVHCQLITDSRLFSAGPVEYGADPNSRATPYDLGMPGTLPVLNRRAVDLALRAGLALGCTIHSHSTFARKHYFYPDLPKGFQITQYDRPLCTGGRLAFEVDDRARTVGIRRIHLEEDAAKMIHDETFGDSLVDYNRAGVPLIEIVTEPELEGPEEAEAALRTLHRLVVHLGVCDGNMQEGSFRCDANLSLAGDGTDGPRIELKNLNSFRFVRRGLNAEIRRLHQGPTDENTRAQTRLYDPTEDRTVPMRDKEASPDYRYVSDPDLPTLTVDYERLRRVRQQLPELPSRRVRRFQLDWGLSKDDAEILVDPPRRAGFFERAVDRAPELAGEIANLVIHELLGIVEQSVFEADVSAADVARVARLVADGEISSSGAAATLEQLVETDESPDEVVDRLDLRQVSDESRLEELVDGVLADEPDLVEEYREGKQKLFGHFMGQIMQASSGRADPEKASELLREKLEGD